MADDLATHNPAAPLVERAGAVHLHSTFFDGGDSVEQIVAAATEAGLDYLLLTDHDTLGAAEAGYGGYHGDVLLAVGAEVSCAGGEHFLALGASGVDDLAKGEAVANTHAVRRRGGRIVLAHVGGSLVRDVPSKASGWHTWEGVCFDAMEVWSFMHDWIDALGLFQIPQAWLRPLDRITGPKPWVMRRYDELTQRRRVGLVGGLDNHAKRIPLLKRLPLLRRVCVFEHAFLFGVFNHHVLVPSPTGDAAVDTAALIEALAVGRGFACLTASGCGVGSRLIAETPACVLGMGDEAKYAGEGRLKLVLPARGSVRLLCDGQVIRAGEGDRLEAPIRQAGVYRAEVRRAGKPWILTNPIYLRAGAG